MVKLRIKRINEDASQLQQQKLTLLNDKQRITQEFNKAQEIYNNAIKKRDDALKPIEAKLLQIEQQLASETGTSNVSNNTNESPNEALNEGVNSKHTLLSGAIINAVNNSDMSYELSTEEANRLARKINDFINSNKNSKTLYEDMRMMIKKYFLNHKNISLSQSEINSFNDALKNELRNSKYTVFNLFRNESNELVLNIDDYVNVDELEADLADLDFDITEDLDNNTITILNYNENFEDDLLEILEYYGLMKINREKFF